MGTRDLAMLRAFWLVVVHADRADLHDRLRRSLADAPWAQVILDRRRGDRRRRSVQVPADRRRSERRRLQPVRDTDPEGYRLIQSADGYEVFQARSRAAARCAECGAALEVEMPRFAELPARLEVDVIHQARSGSAPAQHVVETQAFRASGRPFLACRMVARRRAAVG